MRRFLIDAHHLGMGQTGNETWTRNMITATKDLGAHDEMEFAVAGEGREIIRRLTDAPAHLVSSSSARRLVVDLPSLIRATGCRAVLATYTAPLTRCPSVVAVHDVSPWHREAREWLPRATRARHRATVGISARRAHTLIVPSEATRADLVDRLGTAAERVAVAPCAVDLELGRLLAATPARPADGCLRVLAVGTIVPRKNLVMLARATRAARDAGVPVKLRLVGPVPPAGRPLVTEIEALLGPDVESVGYVTDAQLAVEYRSTDVVCFPSLFEGFGMPIVEAMAAGVPVVVSDATASREVIGDAALVCGAHDPRAWREALVRLWQDPVLRQRLSADGLRRAAGFSWHESAKIVLHALDAAAGRRRGY